MPDRGSVLVVRDGNALQLAVVLARKDKQALELVTGPGRPRPVPESRVALDLGSACPATATEAMARWLTAFAAEVAGERAGLELEPVWQLLLEGGADADFSDLADLALPASPRPAQRAALLLAIEGELPYFRRKGERYQPRSAAEVAQQQAGLRKATERAAQRAALLELLTRARRGEDVGPIDPVHSADLADLLALAAGDEVGAPARRAARLLSEATLSATPEGAFRTLVALGRIDRDAHLALDRSGLSRPHRPAAVEQARGTAADLAGRRDLRHLPTWTVDEPWTTDPDDAVSLESLEGGGLRLYVHVTDAASAIAPGSAVDQDAFERGASIYLPDARLPMLPLDAEERLALLPGGDRAAITLTLDLGADLQPRSAETFASVIRVDAKCSYDEVDQAIARGEAPWVALQRACAALATTRAAAGAVQFSLPEARVFLDDGAIRLQRIPTGSPARAMVAELMVTANARWAELAAANGLPVVYRRQERPGESLPRREDYPTELAYFFAIRRLLPRGQLSAEPLPHSGLGLARYVQATSPLRRYQDLVTQRQLGAWLAGRTPPHDAAEVLRVAGAADESAREIAALERERVVHWLVRYLEPRVGQRLGAEVLGEIPGQRYAVMLDELCLEQPLRSDEPLSAGARVEVVLTGLSVFHRQLHLRKA